MKITSKTILIAAIILCSIASSYAWLRRGYSDAEVVSRSELIVVGRVRPGSIVLVPHETKNQGASWEHHVDLEISEVLKGQAPSNTMAVSIHYGLDPVIGGYSSNQFAFFNVRGIHTNYPKDVIEIFDTGDSAVSFTPITGDIRTNHIWLLHHVSPSVHTDSDTIGIVDPEDIQPVSKKAELTRYLK